MKNLIKFLSLLTIAVFMLASCEGPMGPAGEDGIDGIDGEDGIDGKDGKDVLPLCLKCHSAANMIAKEAQFELSDKGERGARSGKYCARCHTTEGFHEIVKMGTFFVSNVMLNGTKHGCTTCHKHSTFEFSGDTVSQVLRTIAPVYTNFDNMDTVSNSYKATIASDYGPINNLCGTCHQYRGSRSGMVYTDTLLKKTNVKFSDYPFWPIANVSSNENNVVKFKVGANIDIHEGANQADYLISKSGYEYTGKTYTKTTSHSGFTCTQCHFNKYDAGKGGHTMIVNRLDPKCAVCHTGATSIDNKRTATLASINEKLAQLGDLLAARKVFKKSSSTSSSAINGFTYSAVPSHDFYGTLLPTTLSTEKFALGISNKTSVSTTNGLLQYYAEVTWKTDADYATRIGRPWKYGELGAAWNFIYVYTTASSANRAVHNPTYAMQLLQTSIDWLTANP